MDDSKKFSVSDLQRVFHAPWGVIQFSTFDAEAFQNGLRFLLGPLAGVPEMVRVLQRLQSRWDDVVAGTDCTCCYEVEPDRFLRPAGQAARGGFEARLAYCFLLPCGFTTSALAKPFSVYLRLRLARTRDGDLEPKEFFFCDEEGLSLLGFRQMPFFVKGLSQLLQDLQILSGNECTWEDLGARLFDSWVEQGCPRSLPLTLKPGLRGTDGPLEVRLEGAWTGGFPRAKCGYVLLMSGVECKSPLVIQKWLEERPQTLKKLLDALRDQLERIGPLSNSALGQLRLFPDGFKVGDVLEVLKLHLPGLQTASAASGLGYCWLSPTGSPDRREVQKLVADPSRWVLPEETPVVSPPPPDSGQKTPPPPTEEKMDLDLSVKDLCTRLAAVTAAAPEDAEEQAFLERLARVAAACHFNYARRDLVRFHTAVKTGMLTVLGGDPGTGKSSLAEIYARALLGPAFRTSGEGGASYLQVSVSPAWAEPADLLGFEGLTRVFHESRSGLCSFLRRAMAVRESGLRVCCFEEINLACVEHYFSDFMQILSRTDNRVVPGCDRAGLTTENPAAVPLVVGDNVRFFGTCNFDETVKPMSRRFYDRCSYLELELPADAGFPKQVPCIDGEVFAQFCTGEVALPVYAGWARPRAAVLPEVGRLFVLLQERLEPLGLQPSPRVAAEILKYVRARPPLPDGSERTQGLLQLHALDEAVAQRIVSKYRPDPIRQADEADGLREFFEEAGWTASSTLMETLDGRYEVPQF